MKKDRDCNAGITPYPIYQPYQFGMPMQMTPNMVPQINPNMLNQSYNTNNFQAGTSSIEQQLVTMSNQISSLERRVNNLENLIGNTSTQYNTSNYQVM